MPENLLEFFSDKNRPKLSLVDKEVSGIAFDVHNRKLRKDWIDSFLNQGVVDLPEELKNDLKDISLLLDKIIEYMKKSYQVSRFKVREENISLDFDEQWKNGHDSFSNNEDTANMTTIDSFPRYPHDQQKIKEFYQIEKDSPIYLENEEKLGTLFKQIEEKYPEYIEFLYDDFEKFASSYNSVS